MFRKKYSWAICYSILLTVFTLYIALDTFVISRAYTTVPSGQVEAQTSDADDTGDADDVGDTDDAGDTDDTEKKDTNGAAQQEAIVTENSYSDENINIAVTQYREYDTDIYVAEVVLSSQESLKTAFAKDTYGRNVTEKTSAIAERSCAILAINGDYYGSQRSGYVIRNGILYRDTAANDQQDLVIYEDGSFEIITEPEVTAQELLDNGAMQVLSFGPALIEDGAVSVSEDAEVGKAKASNPRTAIGITEEGHYLFIVSDGRTSESEGLTLYQLATFAQSLGAQTVYNLDGGGSSTLYFNGAVLNNPTTNGTRISERQVSDIVYIGS